MRLTGENVWRERKTTGTLVAHFLNFLLLAIKAKTPARERRDGDIHLQGVKSYLYPNR